MKQGERELEEYKAAGELTVATLHNMERKGFLSEKRLQEELEKLRDELAIQKSMKSAPELETGPVFDDAYELDFYTPGISFYLTFTDKYKRIANTTNTTKVLYEALIYGNYELIETQIEPKKKFYRQCRTSTVITDFGKFTIHIITYIYPPVGDEKTLYFYVSVKNNLREYFMIHKEYLETQKIFDELKHEMSQELKDKCEFNIRKICDAHDKILHHRRDEEFSDSSSSSSSSSEESDEDVQSNNDAEILKAIKTTEGHLLDLKQKIQEVKDERSEHLVDIVNIREIIGRIFVIEDSLETIISELNNAFFKLLYQTTDSSDLSIRERGALYCEMILERDPTNSIPKRYHGDILESLLRGTHAKIVYSIDAKDEFTSMRKKLKQFRRIFITYKTLLSDSESSLDISMLDGICRGISEQTEKLNRRMMTVEEIVFDAREIARYIMRNIQHPNNQTISSMNAHEFHTWLINTRRGFIEEQTRRLQQAAQQAAQQQRLQQAAQQQRLQQAAQQQRLQQGKEKLARLQELYENMKSKDEIDVSEASSFNENRWVEYISSTSIEKLCRESEEIHYKISYSIAQANKIITKLHNTIIENLGSGAEPVKGGRFLRSINPIGTATLQVREESSYWQLSLRETSQTVEINGLEVGTIEMLNDRCCGKYGAQRFGQVLDARLDLRSKAEPNFAKPYLSDGIDLYS